MLWHRRGVETPRPEVPQAVGRWRRAREDVRASRLLAAGRGVQEITRALKGSRRLVRQIRDGVHAPPDQPRSGAEPLWMAQVDWPQIIHGLGLGHPLKFLWEKKAQALTTYSNFWKQFCRKFPQYRGFERIPHSLGHSLADRGGRLSRRTLGFQADRPPYAPGNGEVQD